MTTWQNRILGSGVEDAEQLLANPLNWRIHPKNQQDSLVEVLDRVGWIQQVVVNQRTGFVVDGHLRVALAITRGEQVPVLYVDLSESEEQLVLASLDSLSHMAVIDETQLSSLLKSLQSQDESLSELLANIAAEMNVSLDASEPPGDPGAQLDRAEELREKWQVERGQVWQIGKHRLMCGDSYSELDRQILLDGATPDMLHTDPPYGISIVQPRNGNTSAAIGGAKPFGGTSGTNRKSGVAERNASSVEHSRYVQHGKPSRNSIIQSNLYPVIEGDDRPFEPGFLLEIAPIIVLWGANYYADQLPVSQGWIVWDKREQITRNTFADCELAWTNQETPARIFAHLWNGLHKGSQHGERRIHPTEKPVALFAEIGRLLCPNGLWLDLFAGSGAQIVAAQEVGASCYALEYEPIYVGVMLQRLADMGLDPRLTST